MMAEGGRDSDADLEQAESCTEDEEEEEVVAALLCFLII